MSLLRYSSNPLRRPDELALGAREFLAEAACRLPSPWILLVGGSGLGSARLRLAQSAVRFDERPSYFCHAALVLDVDPLDPLRSTGVEIRLGLDEATGPERSHVSFFRLDRYANDRRYPNLAALAASEASPPQGSPPLPERLREAALREHPGRGAHGFAPWIAAWTSYLLAPATNPLTADVPFPSVALIDFVHATAGVDLSPAAATPALCPEALWASARYFAEQPGIRWQALSRIRQPILSLPEAAAGSLASAYDAFRTKPSKGRGG